MGIFYPHYLPFFSYPSNSPWKYNPFGDFIIQKALAAGSRIVADLRPLLSNGVPSRIKNFVGRILRHHTSTLSRQTEKLHQIIGGPVSVLPPDTRHVDYEVIPLMIADGCLYHCDFCCVKSRLSFQRRS